ncbi:SAVED domain-containing protein [uncultured Propionibacterium sp.]|uniref:SAVED domain-containing protein n=1 Tax=uncultured Propionibacterium sp. TaxID=218066 RepID=UPI00292FA617|nr:SAVED domain-containing protein [uncultured Propionibacterium sp.]
MPATGAAHDPRGPIFISYRHSDGKTIADQLVRLLRAAGLPVWIDQSDLTTGRFEDRIRQAMDEGLSGGVLVVTPDVAKSVIIKKVEAAGLLGLIDRDSRFSLSIVNAASDDWTGLDEPLGRRKGTLERIKQFTATPEEGLTEQAGKELVTAYVKDHFAAPTTGGDHLDLRIETRVAPPSPARAEHHLDIYLSSPSDDEAISREGLEDLRTTLGIVRDAIASSRTPLLRVSGKPHLSVAFALGAQFPKTLIGRAEAVTADGEVWSSSGPASPEGIVRRERQDERESLSTAKEVAVYVDLIEPRNDGPFDDFVNRPPAGLTAWAHLRIPDECFGHGHLFGPELGQKIALEAAHEIRELSYEHGTAHVHLFLRCPFPVAFLIGRLVNTLDLTVYEYSKSDGRYIPALEVDTSRSGNVIRKVLAP